MHTSLVVLGVNGRSWKMGLVLILTRGGVVKIWVPLMDTDYARPDIAASWARLKDAYCSCKFG